MNAVVVLHEATHTGAPRFGGLLAAALQQHLDVCVVSLCDGPLIGWLKERLGAGNVVVLDLGELRHRIPFAERLRVAEATLADIPGELVYINSAAAAEFVVAAKSLGRTAILHVHEKAETLRRLMEIDLLKYEVISMCDGVVLAADELRRDLAEVFGFVPERCMNFGMGLDIEEIERLARDPIELPPRNADGKPLRRNGRLVIGMCGTAAPRKGSDIFLEAASSLPEHDFVWVGRWSSAEAPDNTAFTDFRQWKLPNMFVTDSVDNPYQYIARFDVFFLSSVEDPNPAVLYEAMLLNVPILSFSRTTAVADFLGRNGILCYGKTNTADAVRVLRAIDADDIRSAGLRRAPEGYRNGIDMKQKVVGLVRFLGSL